MKNKNYINSKGNERNRSIGGNESKFPVSSVELNLFPRSFGGAAGPVQPPTSSVKGLQDHVSWKNVFWLVFGSFWLVVGSLFINFP